MNSRANTSGRSLILFVLSVPLMGAVGNMRVRNPQTAIRSQPTAPARIDRCVVATKGHDMMVDLTLHAVQVGVSDVEFAFGGYRADFGVVEDFRLDWHGKNAQRVHFHEHNDQAFSADVVRYVQCSFSAVTLANGTTWEQPATYSQTDWKGNPVRR